jgi:hypothetical protein
MAELRKKERRRDFDSAQSFPFTDRVGRVIDQDRRTMPDRRLNSIQHEGIPFPNMDDAPIWLH